jgi:hypothetical protein
MDKTLQNLFDRIEKEVCPELHEEMGGGQQ